MTKQLDHREHPSGAEEQTLLRERYLGCFLGGAVGDALGYPVEFKSENRIRAEYGPRGIQTLEQAGSPAGISDDTQMTLFAACALVYGKKEGVELPQALWTGYQEWLGTQGDPDRMEDPEKPRLWIYRDRRLHARRSPGLTCQRSIGALPRGGTMERPANNSKGCGTVMRAAPFGLSAKNQQDAHQMAALDAALTHGHPLAWTSSSLLAQLIHHIVWVRPERNYRLEEALPHVDVPGDTEARPLLERAVRLALDPGISDLDGIHELGEGWVAEEALAIALFCAVRHQEDFAAAIRSAVNHKGDSDSTGAVCGNLLGAWLGREAVEKAFSLASLELRDLIERAAEELLSSVKEEEVSL